MAGVAAESFTSGVGVCDVLLLVPELLFLAFMLVAALNATRDLTVSIRGGGRPHSAEGHGGGSSAVRARFTGAPRVLLAAAGATVFAAVVIHTVALSLKVVLQARARAVVLAAAAAAVMAALAVVTPVLVVLMGAAAVGFSAPLMLARICGRLKGAAWK